MNTVNLTDSSNNPADVNGLGSGVYALDANAAGGKGSEIILYQDGSDIVGRVGTTDYFTISNSGTEITLTQHSSR